MEDVIHWVGGTLIQWACSVAVCLPFVVVAIRSTRLRGQDVRLCAFIQLAIFFLISLALTRLDPVLSIIRSPWQAMILEAVWALVFIFGTRSVSRAGLTMRISKPAWRDSMAVTGLMLLFVVGRRLAVEFLGVGQGGTTSIGLEYVLYELTMPGIAEELSYRGVIQPELDAALSLPPLALGEGRREGVVQWGWVIASLLFWAPHAFQVDPQMQLSFYWPTLTQQLILGFVLGWIRERTSSVFPSMLTHNLVNVCRILI